MPQPPKPASILTFTFGWRSTSKVLVQVEPFTEPRHTEVQAILERMPTPAMEVGGHQRWVIRMANGRKPFGLEMQALDSEAGLSKTMLARMKELGGIGMRSMLELIDRMVAVASDKLATETVSLMAHQVSLDVLRFQRIPCPKNWTYQNSVQFRFDRGTKLFLPHGAMPFTGEETEQEERGERIVRFRRRVVPGLSAVVAIRHDEDACIHVAIPGIPWTHPLVGWTNIEQVVQTSFQRSLKEPILRG